MSIRYEPRPSSMGRPFNPAKCAAEIPPPEGSNTLRQCLCAPESASEFCWTHSTRVEAATKKAAERGYKQGRLDAAVRAGAVERLECQVAAQKGVIADLSDGLQGLLEAVSGAIMAVDDADLVERLNKARRAML